MNINVPESARDHFWEEPFEGSWEFWAFRFKPPCKPDDELMFRFDGKPVARAVCWFIEPPGESSCDTTGKYEHRWKVFWWPHTFEDLRKGKETD